MKTISYKEFQTEMAQTLQRVVDDHSPIVITQANGRAAVLMSLEDFNAYEATRYLAASPRNAERLNRSIAQIRAGQGTAHELIEP